ALEHHREMHPDDRAVLPDVALFEAHRVDLARVQARALLVDDLGILGVRDVLAAQPEELVLRVAEDLAQAAVDPDEAPVRADMREPGAGQLECAAKALFALAQRGEIVGLGERRLERSDLGGHSRGFYPRGRARGLLKLPVAPTACQKSVRTLPARRHAKAGHAKGR